MQQFIYVESSCAIIGDRNTDTTSGFLCVGWCMHVFESILVLVMIGRYKLTPWSNGENG